MASSNSGFLQIALSNAYAYSNSSNNDLVLYQSNTSNQVLLGNMPNSYANLTMTSSNITIGVLGNTSNSTITLNTGLTVSGTGNVGVNTSVPVYPLQVAGTANIQSDMRVSSNLYVSQNIIPGSVVIAKSSNLGSNTNVVITPSNILGYTFCNATSNVGINNATPQTTLDVTGNIRCAGFVSACNIGFKNRIINGDMRFDQRNQGASGGVAYGSTGCNAYALDRFKGAIGQASCSINAMQVPLTTTDQTTVGGFTKAACLSALPSYGLSAYMPYDSASPNDLVGSLLTSSTATGGGYSSNARFGSTSFDLTGNTAGSNTTTNYITYNMPSTASPPLTLSFWFYPLVNNVPAQVIGSFNSSGFAYGNQWYINGNAGLNIDTYVGSSTNYSITSSNSIISTKTWYNLCIVYSYSSVVSAYLNGSLIGSSSSALPASGAFVTTANAAINMLRVGCQSASNYGFKGYIDEFRIYNRALSATEVSSLYYGAYAPAAPTTGLISQVGFESNVTDSLGYLTSPSVTGAAYQTNAVVGTYALDCTGNPGGTGSSNASTYATYAMSSSISPPLSVSFWFNANINTSIQVLWDMSSGTQYGPQIYLTGSGGLNSDVYVGSSTDYGANTPSSVVSVGTWNHVCLTYGYSSYAALYLNGVVMATGTSVLPSSGTFVSATNTSLTNICIGAQNQSSTFIYPFQGYIDDYRMYNRVLSLSEVAGLYYSNQLSGYTLFQQAIEGQNLIDLMWGSSSAQPATVSTWIKNNTSAAQSFTMSVNSPGLVGYLNFENTVNDQVGGGLLSKPKAVGGATYSASTFKVGSVSLDLTANTAGGTATKSVEYTVPINSSPPLAVSFWIYPNSVSTTQVLWTLAGSTAATWGTQLYIAPNAAITFDVFVGGSTNYASFASASNSVTVNAWNHVCGVIPYGAAPALYVNGSLTGSGTTIPSTGNFTTTTGSAITGMRIGSWVTTGSYATKGYIDDFRMYNRALTASQVSALYSANSGSTTPFTYLPARSIVYNTPSISASSWQKVWFSIPGDTTGLIPTDTTAGLTWSLCLGANSNYATSNVAAQTGNALTVWNSATNYTGTSTQIMGASSSNFLAGLTNSIYVTGLQFEKGNIVTPFEVRAYALELALCQRYYVMLVSNPYGYAYFTQPCVSISSTNAIGTICLPVAMRAVPTALLSSGAFTYLTMTGTVTSIAIQQDGTCTSTVAINCTGTGLTGGRCSILRANNSTTAYMAFDVEL